MSDPKEVKIIKMIESLLKTGESDSTFRESITAFVDQQAKISLSHGLSLSDEQKAREVAVLMKFLREYGGIEGVKTREFEELVGILGKILSEQFEVDWREFFTNWRPGSTSTRMAYGAHLHSLTGSFLNAVFNDLI